MGRALLLGEHLGPILYQLPPRFPCHLELLKRFLATLPADLAHVIEFRDERWLNDDVFALLEQYGVGLCVADMPGLDYPLRATSQTVYVRFHGSQVLYGDCYGREDLVLWAARLTHLVGEGRHVYAYFNNDAEAYAVQNARELARQMAGVSSQ